MAIVENQEQVDKLIEIKKDIPLLKNIIYLDPRGLRNYKKNNLSSLNDISSPDKLKNITKFQTELKKETSQTKLRYEVNSTLYIWYYRTIQRSCFIK